MEIPSTDSAAELALTGATTSASSAKPSEIEREVMDFFEQYRNPILRYVLAIGLNVCDAEEITQEAFLSLFRHLQSGKSRRNLRGWIFRVAHNLALKQRHANQRLQNRVEPSEGVMERQLDPTPNPEEQLIG